MVENLMRKHLNVFVIFCLPKNSINAFCLNLILFNIFAVMFEYIFVVISILFFFFFVSLCKKLFAVPHCLLRTYLNWKTIIFKNFLGDKLVCIIMHSFFFKILILHVIYRKMWPKKKQFDLVQYSLSSLRS